MTIRNLIHQWNSKNQLIKAHKIIIVLAGLSIKESDYVLASEFDIELWDQNVISELFNLSMKPEELRERLLKEISLKPLTISERYRDNITYLVIKPLMTTYVLDDERLYWYFNKWLRAHIITELQMILTTKEERAKHIELFEGTKTKRGFLNIKKQRKEVDYWNTVYNQLRENNLLDREQQDTYLSYMNELIEEYNAQSKFFESEDYLIKTEKLIRSRLYNATVKNEICAFKISQMQNHIKVTPLEDGAYMLNITLITEKEGNVLNWILTSEFTSYYNETSKKYEYYWHSSSFNEIVVKIYRIFTEYYEITAKDTLWDTAFK